MRGPLGVRWVSIDVLPHRCCLCDGELKQPQTKETEPLQPSLKVFTVSQEKNCYILYAAVEQVDHFKFKRGHVL